MATEWMDNLLNGKQNKEAMVSQGTDAKNHFDRKVLAHPWVESILELDPVQVEAEYVAKLKQEAMVLGKTAALDDVIADGVTPEETVNRDYKRDVSSLSDYALAELLAEARGHKAQNTNEMYYELKEAAKKEVASSREKAEKALLELIPDNSQLDWQKAFKEFTKNAIPTEPKEKDLFKSEVPEAPHNFNKPTEEKFKLPKDPEKAIPGNGREADERKEVTQQAGVLQKDIVEGTSKEASQNKQAWTSAKPFEVQSENARSQMFFATKKEANDYAKELRSKGHDAKVVDHSNIEPDASLKIADHNGYSIVEKDGRYQVKSKHVTVKDFDSESAAKAWIDKPEPNKKEAHCGECPGDPGMEQKGAPEEIEKDAAQNGAVISAFVSGRGGASSANLHVVTGTKGMVLVNYETPIAYRSAEGELFMNADKYSPTTSKIQSAIKAAAGGQIKEVSAAELEEVMQGKPGIVPNAPAAGAPVAEKQADGPSASDNCPVCGQAGKDLGNGQKENMSCEACGLTYACASLKATAEIENRASKAEVIKKVAELSKTAEVSSPWVVTTDEQGNEVIARVDQTVTNTKQSEEDKTEEILK